MRHHRHSVTEDPVKLVGIAAIAAAIGAVVAMLVTPRSGKQVRNGLKRRTDHLKDEVHERFVNSIDEVGDTVEDTKERLQTTATKVANDAKSTANKVSKDAKVTKTRAKATTKPATTPRRKSV